mgnify:CR=1 FL=1
MSTPPKKKNPEELRSQQWFGRHDRDAVSYTHLTLPTKA